MPDNTFGIPSGQSASYPGDPNDFSSDGYGGGGGFDAYGLLNTGIEATPGLIAAIAGAINGANGNPNPIYVTNPNNQGYYNNTGTNGNTLLYIGIGLVVAIILVAVIIMATRK